MTQPKKRCVPCVESKLRKLVREKTRENNLQKARIAELEAENAKLKELKEVIGLHREQKLEKDVASADRRLWNLALVGSDAITSLEARNAELAGALKEIADSDHLGNSWARHKAKEVIK